MEARSFYDVKFTPCTSSQISQPIPRTNRKPTAISLSQVAGAAVSASLTHMGQSGTLVESLAISYYKCPFLPRLCAPFLFTLSQTTTLNLTVTMRLKFKSQHIRGVLPMLAGMVCGDVAKWYAVRAAVPDVLFLDTALGAETREK